MAAPAPVRRRFQNFQDLMRHRVTEILLVASPYDAFVLGEAGELGERLLGEFRNLDLHYAPALTSVATGAEALALASEQRRFSVILTTPNLADMNGAELALRARAQGIEAPVVLLAWDSGEIKDLAARFDLSAVERSFVWLGDARILVAILKLIEDRRNASHDVAAVGVQVILLIEDSIRNYSSFLPVIYSELFHHSRRLIAEGVNLSQKILRVRARPKILLATSYEEAERAFGAFHEDVLGVISDVEFPEGGVKCAEAGVRFARRVRAAHPDIPIILHSSRAENAALAESVGAAFLLKGSAVVLQQLRRVMLEDFAFGDFVFRGADGAEVALATDLRSLETVLAQVPDEALVRHASHNHFSRWLKARTEFALAHELRPRRPEDFPDVGALRRGLTESIARYRRGQAQAVVADFDPESFEDTGDFHRIGGGSIGGKARGLAFVRRLLAEAGLRERFAGVEIAVPPAVVVATDVFDRFLEDNDLRSFAIECGDDVEIERRFLEARFPEQPQRELEALFGREREPLAVRSSSLLEDSHHQPFTGVYDTRMLANDGPSAKVRLAEALIGIKRVYASVFRAATKSYLRATSYRLEEEKMAVLLQRVVGSRHGERFYPDLAGVVRSYNFYPEPGTQASDGVAAVALGLGRLVAEGGACRRLCPPHPLRGSLAASSRALLESTQRGFWAVPLGEAGRNGGMAESWYGLEVAEADGTLARVASTWSAQDDTLSDGLARRGVRVVTFAPLLREAAFPLAEILSLLAEEGSRAVGAPVEIEFAVRLAAREGERSDFGFLQLRPLALRRESEAVEIGDFDPALALCESDQVLGNGVTTGLRDLVVVDFRRFDRARSADAAAEIGRINVALVAEEAPYVLVGVGRWGSRDPWLGIPVTWDQVCGAAAIVEAGLRDVAVAPSQGSHFFHNLTSFNVGYFTVNPSEGVGRIDWDWLDRQPARSEKSHVRHLRLDSPLTVKIDGRRGHGVVLKP